MCIYRVIQSPMAKFYESLGSSFGVENVNKLLFKSSPLSSYAV